MANKTEFGENFEFRIGNGSAKNLRFDDVIQCRKFNTNRTEIWKFFDLQTENSSAKNLHFDDVKQWRNFTANGPKCGDNCLSVR